MSKIASIEAGQRAAMLVLSLAIAIAFLLAADTKIRDPQNQTQLRWAFAFSEGTADIRALKEIGALVTEYFPEDDGVWLGGGESWWLPSPASSEQRFLQIRLLVPEWKKDPALVTVAWSDVVLGAAEITPGSVHLMSIDLEPLIGSNFKTYLSMKCTPAEKVPGSTDIRALCAKVIEVQSVREASQ